MKPVITEELILVRPGLNNLSASEVIRLLCERLTTLGYTDPTYFTQVMEREKKFPTGLPTVPYAAAIPHGESIGVQDTGVALAILNDPVPFQAMDAPSNVLDVRLVFLLAVADTSKQVAMLQWVSDTVQNQSVLEGLAASKTPEEALSIISPLINEQSLSNEEPNNV